MLGRNVLLFESSVNSEYSKTELIPPAKPAKFESSVNSEYSKTVLFVVKHKF